MLHEKSYSLTLANDGFVFALVVVVIQTVPPWGRRGFKPRIRPPYPQRVVKDD